MLVNAIVDTIGIISIYCTDFLINHAELQVNMSLTYMYVIYESVIMLLFFLGIFGVKKYPGFIQYRWLL